VEYKDSEYNLSHICVAHMNELCHTYERVMLYSTTNWKTKTLSMTFSFGWRDASVTLLKSSGSESFWCVTCRLLRCAKWFLIQVCDMNHTYVWHDFSYMCDMTHSCVWYDLFICVTCLIHMCDMTHSHVWHDSCKCVTWLIHMCAMTRSYACN